MRNLTYVLDRLGASFGARPSTEEVECDHSSGGGKANPGPDVRQGQSTPNIQGHGVEKAKAIGPDRTTGKEVQAVTPCMVPVYLAMS